MNAMEVASMMIVFDNPVMHVVDYPAEHAVELGEVVDHEDAAVRRGSVAGHAACS